MITKIFEIKLFIILLFLLITFVPGTNKDLFSQTHLFDSLVTAGIDQIYNIKFKDAESTFKIIQKDYPTHPSSKFFSAMITWWKIMLDMDYEGFDDELIEQLDDTIDYCEELLDENPDNVDALFFQGGALGFRGRLYSIRQSWLNAALDGKDALPLVFKAYELDPGNKDVQLGFGIYNYYAEVIPQKYPFVKPFMMFFPGGDKIKGLEQLKDAAENGKFAKTESLHFLMTIYYQIEENFTEALNYAKILKDKYPDNPTFQKYYGRIYVKRNDYDSASKIFAQIFKKSNERIPGYTDKIRREASYYVGMNYKLVGNSDSARYYFEECERLCRILDEDEESGFLINSVLYLGMIYDETGLREKALQNYKEVLDFKPHGNSREIAEKYIIKAYKKL